MVDGYCGYQKACDTYHITRLGYWAHARRKFTDEPPNKRFEYRQKESKPILDQLQKWLEKSLATVAPKTKLGEALTYLNNQWDRLVRYLNNGNYPIDNNVAERAIHPFTIGRKSWLFSHSQAGAKASANLYSLISTAKANGLNEYEYLERIFKELPNAQSVEGIEKLLPWNAEVV